MAFKRFVPISKRKLNKNFQINYYFVFFSYESSTLTHILLLQYHVEVDLQVL